MTTPSDTATGQRPRYMLPLLRLALPMIGMMVTRMLMGFVDFFMVSMLGTEAQAAISPATILVFTVACLGMGLATSVQTFVSQADGRRESHRAGGYAWQTYYVAIASLLLVVPLVATLPTWFGWIAALAHQPATVARLEVDYLHIALWSVPLAVACGGLEGFFNGAQRPRIALIAMIAGVIVNVFGNWLLIFGNLGFPAWGIGGAALATVVGWGIRAGIMTMALLSAEIDDRYHTRSAMAFDPVRLRGMLRVGGPTAIQWLVDIGAWVVFLQVIIPSYGTVAMAASNAAVQYMHLAFMPAIGIGMALCSQVGYVIGEGRPKEAYPRARAAMTMTGVYMTLIGLLLVIAGRPLMAVFSSDPQVLALGRVTLIWVATFQLFDAMCITYMNALRGAGDTRVPAITALLLSWLYFVPLSHTLVFAPGEGWIDGLPQAGLGALGGWLALMSYAMLLGIAMLLRWRSGRWRAIRLSRGN